MWCTSFVWLHSALCCKILFIFFHFAVVLSSTTHSTPLRDDTTTPRTTPLVHSTGDGHLGCFHSYKGKAATNTLVHFCWWTYTLTSTGFTPTSEISGSEWCIYLSLDKTANSFPKWLDHFPVPAGLFHLGHLCVCTHACVCVCMCARMCERVSVSVSVVVSFVFLTWVMLFSNFSRASWSFGDLVV